MNFFVKKLMQRVISNESLSFRPQGEIFVSSLERR